MCSKDLKISKSKCARCKVVPRCQSFLLFCSYVSQFAKFGIRGVDLLSFTEKQLNDFGIVHSIHVNRAQTSINQLIVYQQSFDKKLKKEQKLRQKEKPYYDLLDEVKLIREKNPSYQSPYYIKYWKAMDVFMWLESKENLAQLGMYIKPFAMERITGKDLLEMIYKPDEHFHEIVSEFSRPVQYDPIFDKANHIFCV